MLNWLTRILGTRSSSARSRLNTTWHPPQGMPIQTAEDLGDLVRRCGYSAIEAEILALAVPVFHIIAGRPAVDAPLGGTRLGGPPDLPVGTPWPVGTGGLASFLGQFDLADVAARTGSNDLPDRGLLSLFILRMDGAGEPVEMLSLITPEGTPLQRLTPPTDRSFFGDATTGYLQPVEVSGFVPGLSIALSDIERLELGQRFPEQDETDFLYLLNLKPSGAIGEWLGRGFDEGVDDQRQVAHARRIGRPDLSRYTFIKDWDEWLSLKQKRLPMANGRIYQPWSDEDDEDVRWLLDNRTAFDAGVEALRLLIRLESNKPMGLWINDADPIFVMIDADDLSRGDLSRPVATVTQG